MPMTWTHSYHTHIVPKLPFGYVRIVGHVDLCQSPRARVLKGDAGVRVLKRCVAEVGKSRSIAAAWIAAASIKRLQGRRYRSCNIDGWDLGTIVIKKLHACQMQLGGEFGDWAVVNASVAHLHHANRSCRVTDKE